MVYLYMLEGHGSQAATSILVRTFSHIKHSSKSHQICTEKKIPQWEICWKEEYITCEINHKTNNTIYRRIIINAFIRYKKRDETWTLHQGDRCHIYLKWILELAADIMEKIKTLNVEQHLKSWQKYNFNLKDFPSYKQD